jgi:hypothetical protein
MKTHVLTGSKDEIAENVARIEGVIREVIVFVEEPGDSIPLSTEEDIFAEMEPFTVRVGIADDSREAIYTRMEGE